MSDTKAATQNAFIDIAGSYQPITVKLLSIPGDVCTSISANDPPQKVQSTVISPQQVEHRGATEQNFLPVPNACLTNAQLEDPRGM